MDFLNARRKMNLIFLYLTVLAIVVYADQVDDLNKLQKDFSEWRLGRAPEFATSIGINRYNDILENFKWQRFDTDKEKTESFLSGLNHIDYGSLDDANKAGYDVFNDTLQTFLRGYKWKEVLTTSDRITGWAINSDFLSCNKVL